MNHTEFVARKTAAVYVADGLDEHTLDAFEYHWLDCPACAEDLKGWREIQQSTPVRSPQRVAPERTHRFAPLLTWRIAAAFLVGLVVSTAVVRWRVARAGADLGERTVVAKVNFSATSIRDCEAVAMNEETQAVVVPIETNTQGPIVARDSEQRELPTNRYRWHSQPDGAQVVRMDSPLLVSRPVHLYGHRSDGSEYRIGCITGQIVNAR